MSLLLATSGDIASGGVAEPEGIDLDGVSDYLSRSTDLVGNVDSKTFTFSCWVYKTVVGTNQRILTLGSTNTRLTASFNSSNQFVVVGINSLGTIILNITALTFIPTNTWTNVVVSIDLLNNNKSILINDIFSSLTITTFTNDLIDFSGIDSAGVSATPIGGTRLKGRLSNLFLSHQYMDLSIEANRRIFINEDGTAVV